jgi:outer membrane lipoprotein
MIWKSPVAVVVTLAALLGGCATNIPPSIRIDVGEPLSVAQVQADPAGTMGKPVRWGGEILSVINRKGSSDVVVLRRALFDDGEPKPDGGEAKRFVARIPGFVDPAEFKAGQRLTVSGHLQGLVTIPVGQYPYPHPVVRVAEYHRWPKYVEPPVPAWHRDPFYCDPFWPWGYSPGWPYCW